MIDIIRDIQSAIEVVAATELGSDYSKLPYVEAIENNSFRTNTERYGVRALAATEVPGVTKTVHLTQAFEVILTKSYFQSMINDSEQVEKSLDNRANLLGIYKQLVNTRVGNANVLNVTDLAVDEPEFLEEEKVVIQRATFNVTYRFSLI